MEDTSYDHFHVVAICVECADIDIIAIARNEEGLTDFFSNLEPELEKAAIRQSEIGFQIPKFKATVVIPNQVATIIPDDGHRTAHVVIAVAHKCKDIFEYCCEMQDQVVMRKMARELTESFLSNTPRRKNTEKTTEKKVTPKQDERARSLLDSLDLPDDLFKGMN